MSYKDIKAGRYTAKPLNVVFGNSSKKGTPEVGIEFPVQWGETPAQTDTVWFVGYFSDSFKTNEKVSHRVLEALDLIGFDGNRANPGFNRDAECSIVVELVPMDDKGGMKPEVSWVNEPGGGKYSAVPVTEVTAFDAAMKERGIDLAKEMAIYRAEKAKKNPGRQAQQEAKKTGPAPF